MIGVYDMVVQEQVHTVPVVETVTSSDQVEIVCPEVIHPGDFFNCVLDMPTGTDLTAEVVMTDDLNKTTPKTTNVMSVPSMYLVIVS